MVRRVAGVGSDDSVKKRFGLIMAAKGEDGGDDGDEEDAMDGSVDCDQVQLIDAKQWKNGRKVKHRQSRTVEEELEENVWVVSLQVFIPFLVAGLGMVGAGLVLDVVQHWPVFQKVSEVFILVPALLGLKGNLEMTLASRLSTQANLGLLDVPREQWNLVIGNIALIQTYFSVGHGMISVLLCWQCQAIVVGSLAAIAAVIMAWVPDGKFNLDHTLLLSASSMLTASLASFVLGLVMVAVIIFSRRLHINPDNVATPIAASLGDLTTLALLSWIASLLFEAIGKKPWLAPMTIGVCLVLTPVWAFLASNNQHTRVVLTTGWSPVVSSMMISSLGGLILDFTVSRFKGIAVFQPVMNGVGGNLVAVQASRISTSLHKTGFPGHFPPGFPPLCMRPGAVFCSDGVHSRMARVLLAMVVPGHLIFSYTISYLQAGHTSLTAIFVLVYLSAALLQVLLLLYVAHTMVHWMWKNGMDPDNSAIPYLTAIGDLLGTGLLAVAFHILFFIGDRDTDVGD